MNKSESEHDETNDAAMRPRLPEHGSSVPEADDDEADDYRAPHWGAR